MNKKKVVIFGTSKVADIAYSCMKDDPASNLEVAAFCVDREYYQESTKEGLPVVKFEDVENIYPPSETAFFCGHRIPSDEYCAKGAVSRCASKRL